MKKYIVKNIVFILLLAAVLPAYAIDFSEPRKVLVSKYANAVYRDLTVLDKMYLEVEQNAVDQDKSGTFFLEIGKRPSYFWSAANKYYLQQVQSLTFDNIMLNSTSSPLIISSMTVKNGSFISYGLALKYNSTEEDPISVINMSGTSPHLYMGNVNLFAMDLSVPDTVPEIDIYARVLKPYSTQDITSIGYRMHQIYLRDLAFSVDGGTALVPFPSPRMMIEAYNHGTAGASYKAHGTSLNFDLESEQTASAGEKLNSYYGPWEVYNSGAMSDSPCPSDVSGDRCSTSDGFDSDDSDFECVNNTNTSNHPYDISPNDYTDGYCWDYNVVTPSSSSYCGDDDRLYNNNQGYYEFKVQEVYAYRNDESITGDERLIFLDQSPRIRVNSDTVVPLINSTHTAWGELVIFSPGNTDLHINGTSFSNATFIKLGDQNDKYPCYTICGGVTCKNNYLYVRNRTLREIKDSSNIPNYWPGEVKQDMFLATYTVGFCPNASERDKSESGLPQYSTYEINRKDLSSGYQWLESLQTNKKVCIRRKVMCNSLTNEVKAARSYKLFSTDY